MTTTDFTTTITVTQSPMEVFNAINNVSGWWSEEVTGGTAQLNDEFHYHFKDVHICKMKLVEVTPGKKVVWHVLDNYFNFTKDKTEWKDTRIVFDISEQDGKTQLRMTHEGLVPEYECYEICENAWTRYIQESLYGLITTGKGQPNAKEEDLHFTTTMLTDATPEEVFAAINNVKGWWTERMTGSSTALNDEFEVQFADVHYSKHKVTELIPGKKVVWLTTDSKLNFISKKDEWTGTKIIFDIKEQDGRTQIHFTHEGLVAQIECFGDCSNAWREYLQDSLLSLIDTGKGNPSIN